MSSEENIALPETLDLVAARPLAQTLLSMRGSDVKIDASQVTRIGGQCLQVLLSAAATWRADHAILKVVAPSQEFIGGLKLLGVDPSTLVGQE
jgi:chemotaxis protein CheX